MCHTPHCRHCGVRDATPENMSEFPRRSVPPTKETLSTGVRRAVVVLTRLPEYKISALRPPTPPPFYSEDDSISSDSRMQWEPQEDSTGSEFSVSPHKKKSGKHTAAPHTSRTTTLTATASNTAANNTTTTNNNTANTSTANTTTSTANTTTTTATTTAAKTAAAANNNTANTSTANNNNNNSNNNITTNVSEPPPAIISSALAHCSSGWTTNLPEKELKVDRVVLARKTSMRWQRGKILAIVTREDGRLKYKVGFDEKGKSLVSGHHVALDTTPKLEQLYVGARVVVKSQDNMFRFQPGVLAELPSRKNRLRFLVFLDCALPLYVGLPFIHLVCRPLENVLDDIPDTTHKFFMTRYLKDWPFPRVSQYKPGQSLKVELNGAMQRCEVQVVDCSLMQLLFQEWIHRGSIRLETMARFFGN
ncbi:histone-lysine N-methyltransferase SETDB1-B-like isoform 2-T2 [Spinachia spinachia]